MFDTPQAVISFDTKGLNGISARLQSLVQDRILPPYWASRPRPALLNSWEGLYFDTTEKTVAELAEAAAGLSVELFVLDDGWFRGRNDDTSSLGDWEPDPDKLPGGIAGIANKVCEQGIGFGLWIEPEMISPDSEMYRAHPEWCLQVPQGPGIQARNQLVLDLCKHEVVDYLAGIFTRLIGSAPISYIKWDMNRNLTEAGSDSLPPHRQGEVAHRWMLGVYRLMSQITSAFPEVLFEGCAGGGGRCDLGALYYMPQYWISDDTDGMERLRIQYGTGMFVPPAAMSAHISDVPNHQVGRVTPLEFRAAVAMSGSFGVELDARSMSAAEQAGIRSVLQRWRRYQPLLTRSRLQWILPPSWDSILPTRPVGGNPSWSPGREAAWMFVSPESGGRRDRSSGGCPWMLVVYAQVLAAPAAAPRILRIPGLDPAGEYRVVLEYSAAPGLQPQQEEFLTFGDDLHLRGLQLPYLAGDYRVIYIEVFPV